MDRKKIIVFSVIIALVMINILALAQETSNHWYLPSINHSVRTPNPCDPNPYPMPTPIDCPTATPTYDPYPPPATQTPSVITNTPEPTQTPWIVTATPISFDNFINLPIIKRNQ